MNTSHPFLPDPYSLEYVTSLFDEMSATYEFVNEIASFGFTQRWRRQCIEPLCLQPEAIVYDFMTGMGESWPFLAELMGPANQLIAIDLSPQMYRHATARLKKFSRHNIKLIQGNALCNHFAANSADCVVSLFGLKTFSVEQQALLAQEVKRILKPGGQFAFIEVSVPPNEALRMLYMFYLKYIIPRLGQVFLGNPQNYRMLGVYTEAFDTCQTMLSFLTEAGLETQYHEYFFGCATGVSGVKPTTLLE